MEQLGFYFFSPSVLRMASEALNIECFKNQVWKFSTKNSNPPLKIRYFGAQIFQERVTTGEPAKPMGSLKVWIVDKFLVWFRSWYTWQNLIKGKGANLNLISAEKIIILEIAE